LGAEEYELLVSTLNKLPILNEDLPKKREEDEFAKRMVIGQKILIEELQKELKTRDLELEKIDLEIVVIDRQVKELDKEIFELDEKIKIEEEKVLPYSLRLNEARERLARKKATVWGDDDKRWLISIVLGWILALLSMENLSVPGSLGCGFMLFWPAILLHSTFDVSNTVKLATRKKDKVKSEWKEARRVLDGLNMKGGRKAGKKDSLVREELKLKSQKGRLKGLEKELKQLKKRLFELEASASASSEAVESLVKEIEDGQNAIAPLIPYSDLLLSDG